MRVICYRITGKTCARAGACHARSRSCGPIRAIWALVLAIAAAPAPVWADDPLELSLMELAHTEVTTVSRKQTDLWDTPAAVHVITQEDIAGCGCSSIPELLRTAPGLNVAQVDDGTWAISARGFNGRFANKMLVLVDGRSVYTSLFSGVFWEQVRVGLDDIERIEIIRGPGGTMWGANAVNGIINIITRTAEDTRGGLIHGMTGSRESVFGGTQFGGSIGNTGDFRVSTGYIRGETLGAILPGPVSGSRIGQGAVRIDLLPSPSTSLSMQGGFNDGSFARTYYLFQAPTDFVRQSVENSAQESNWNLGLALSHVASTDAELTVGVTADRSLLDDPILRSDMRTYAVEAQQRWRANERHELVAGVGVKINDDRFVNTFSAQVDPARQTTHFADLFVQDEFTVIPRRLIATFGTKYEHNEYTGSELQPGARLAWLATPNAMGWFAVSRAVRTPSRIENGGRVIIAALPPGSLGLGTPAAFFMPRGNANFGSEVLVAYEAGSRWIVGPRISVDMASYYNRYDHLRTITNAAPALEFSDGIPYLNVPLDFGNGGSGESYGFEVAVDWRPHSRIGFEAGYTYEEVNIFSISDALGHEGMIWEGATPRHMAFLQSTAHPLGPVRLNANLRYMGRLENLVVQIGPPTGAIPDYLALDLRIGVDVSRVLTAYAGGRNLLAGEHGEFMDEVLSPPNAYQVREQYYAGLRARF